MGINEEWHADISITIELVRGCLQSQFPTLTPINQIEQIGEGWDNKVFLLNQKIIFRFPRRKIAVELIERENKVLNNLSDFLNIQIPLPKYIGHRTSRYPYPFQGYDVIKGKSGHQAQLAMQDRIATLETLAEFLKRLHSIGETQAIAMGAEPQVFDRTSVNKMVSALIERVAKITSRKFCHINNDCLQQEIVLAQHLVLPYGEKCLIHGDLDSRHLLFDNKQLTGIIDWGDIGINNPSVDLAIIWLFYPNNCHQQFFDIYGSVDPNTWQYARFVALYAAFTHMLYAKDIGDNLLLDEAINAVKRINANLLADPVET